ncbi:MAG: NADH-quinone oxidoreductase subunit A [Calditrichia bacterium]
MTLSSYIPILILFVLALLVAAGILIVTHILSPRYRNKIKQTAYESGVPIQTDARLKFPIRFYVVAMMFILFDVEVIFMYPWAVVYNEFISHGTFILWEMIIFIVILFVGYIYLLKSGAFKWE